MKITKILSLSFAAIIISSAAFAESQIISGEVKRSPGLKGDMVVKSLETYPISKKKLTADSSAATWTRVQNVWGKVGENVRLESSHGAEICNGTRDSGYFPIYYELRDQFSHSISKRDHIYVPSENCTRVSLDAYFLQVYDRVGDFTDYGQTEVQDISNTRSYDRGNITIRK